MDVVSAKHVLGVNACNPIKFNKNYYHKRIKKTAQEIWNYDNQRKVELENLGYKVTLIWENDWKVL